MTHTANTFPTLDLILSIVIDGSKSRTVHIFNPLTSPFASALPRPIHVGMRSTPNIRCLVSTRSTTTACGAANNMGVMTLNAKLFRYAHSLPSSASSAIIAALLALPFHFRTGTLFVVVIRYGKSRSHNLIRARLFARIARAKSSCQFSPALRNALDILLGCLACRLRAPFGLPVDLLSLANGIPAPLTGVKDSMPACIALTPTAKLLDSSIINWVLWPMWAEYGANKWVL